MGVLKQILVRHNVVIDYCFEGYIITGSTVVCPSKNSSFTDCNIVTVDSLPSDIDEYEYLYLYGNFSRGASKKSVIESITLSSASWDSTNKTYEVTFTHSSNTDSIIELIPDASITEEQLGALQSANIIGGPQAVGSITLKAMGDVPTIDIPITFVIRGDI